MEYFLHQTAIMQRQTVGSSSSNAWGWGFVVCRWWYPSVLQIPPSANTLTLYGIIVRIPRTRNRSLTVLYAYYTYVSEI